MSVAGQRGHHTVTLQLGRVAETAAGKAPKFAFVAGHNWLAQQKDFSNLITSILF